MRRARREGRIAALLVALVPAVGAAGCSRARSGRSCGRRDEGRGRSAKAVADSTKAAAAKKSSASASAAAKTTRNGRRSRAPPGRRCRARWCRGQRRRAGAAGSRDHGRDRRGAEGARLRRRDEARRRAHAQARDCEGLPRAGQRGPDPPRVRARAGSRGEGEAAGGGDRGEVGRAPSRKSSDIVTCAGASRFAHAQPRSDAAQPAPDHAPKAKPAEASRPGRHVRS